MYKWLLGILFFCIALTGCKQHIVLESSHALHPEGWNVDELIMFEVAVQDTLTPADINLHVRNDGRYPYSNLFLFIRTYAPTGASIRDTFEIMLANPEGKWYGKGIGGRYSLDIPFKKQVRFPFAGTYRIEIQHGMRDPHLKYITDIGIQIKGSKIGKTE